jgi:phage-related protein
MLNGVDSFHQLGLKRISCFAFLTSGAGVHAGSMGSVDGHGEPLCFCGMYRVLGASCNSYPFGYNFAMKPVRFLGDALKSLRDFPEDAKQDAGYQLDKVQRGEQPDDFKPMPSIGKGVEEIRIWDDSGTFRVIYTARLADAVYVLHAFQKKTQATSKRDIDTAKERFAQLTKGRK